MKMKRKITILAYFLCISSLINAQIVLSDSCKILCDNPLNDSIKFNTIFNAESGYWYSYPSDFDKIMPEIEIDSTNEVEFFCSNCRGLKRSISDFTMIIREYDTEYTYPHIKDTANDMYDIDYDKVDYSKIKLIIDKKLDSVLKGGDPFLKNVSVENSCRKKNSLIVLGTNKNQIYFYKIIIAGMYDRGDFYVDFLIKFDKSKSKLYNSISTHMINSFREP